MKISYRWLTDFLDTKETPEEIGYLLTHGGLEVEDIEPYHSIPGGLQGIVIGQVVEVIKHPNADKLRVCKVDLGEGIFKQIVCGAPNVASGQKVLVAQVGSTVYPMHGEPFPIQKAKIRGEVSEGMICAEDELSLGESHEGILVLPETYQTGKPASDYFPVYSDFILEIGLTANRGDAASHYGVARDLYALGIPANKITIPALSNLPSGGISVTLEPHSGCFRYSGLMIRNISVKPSPQWLQDKLRCIGLTPINNIVDATNYILHSWGQPLHAFDTRQIAQSKVVVRQAKAGEKLVLLDGQERILKGHECLITDPEKPLALAGIFGGLHSGITPDTTEIFLESAWFDPATVRKAAKAHQLNTDASFRFERGTDPEFTLPALQFAADLILQIAGGEIPFAPIDNYPAPLSAKKIIFSPERSNALIGKAIPNATQKSILENLEIRITELPDGNWELIVPHYRVDVERAVDITEEILRIYGLNNIEMGHQIRSAMTFSSDEFGLTFRNRLADYLSNRGFFEIITNSLTRSTAFPDESLKTAVPLLNPLSQELDILRPDLLHSMLEASQYNSNRKNTDLRLYEIGKTYSRLPEEEGLKRYQEKKHLVLGMCGRKEPERWNNPKTELGYYSLKSVMEQLLTQAGIRKFHFAPGNDSRFEFCTQLLVAKKPLAVFGKVDVAICSRYDLNKGFWYAEIDLEQLTLQAQSIPFKLAHVPVFPAVRRDLALVLDEQVSYEQLEKIASQAEPRLIRQMGVFDVYRGDKIPAGKKSYALNFILQDETKTLTDSEVEAVMDKLTQQFEMQASATLRN